MIFLLVSIMSFAADIPGEEVFVAPPANSPTASSDKPKASSSTRSKSKKNIVSAGNLPAAYFTPSNRESTNSELVMPTKGSVEVFKGLKVGESLDLYVEHSVIAFPDEKAPVVAISKMGSSKGLKFIGESYLEPNSRRIFVNFNRVVLGDRIFNLKGVGVANNGQPGLTGLYHSREAEYFAGDFVASFVAGYFDGLIPRRTNAYGQTETDPSVDNAVKKGLSSGSLSTAERFREKLKKVPEFSEIKGPFNLKILILDQAKSTN